MDILIKLMALSVIKNTFIVKHTGTENRKLYL